MHNLFFELIRFSIGTQSSLSRMPSAKEWEQLYAMAQKQSLIGICFAGVKKLCNFEEEYYAGMNEMLYLTWMGMAAKIQQRNEVVNRQCVILGERLEADGLRYAILKGQGVAQLYGSLALLRQSGDIDVWVKGGMKHVLKYCNKNFGDVEWDYINAHVPFFKDTEVELHWRAQALTNLCANRRLQKWFALHENEIIGGNALICNKEVVVPTEEFNAFYILLHCYHHMFESGLGLRQLMDYYFALIAYANVNVRELSANLNVNTLFLGGGMERFASGVLWMMKAVFGMNDSTQNTLSSKLGIVPDENEGRFLLNEVMQNGNFGHYDERIKKLGSGKMSELWRNVQHNWHLASHYPSELFWQPIWLTYHWFWKRLVVRG